jgi:hypothetical protein
MELFIRVDENGNTVDHPILGDNFRQAFPHIDVDNLPSEFARFVRVPSPSLGMYEVLVSDEPNYQRIDGVFTDVWDIREMTPEEKSAKQQAVRNAFNARPQFENWSAWVLDEATCTMQPPIPRPDKNQAQIALGIYTYWCGAENGWKETPAKPNDGNEYKFDFFIWEWIVITP